MHSLMLVKYHSDLSFEQSLRIPFSYVSKDASPSIVTLLLTTTLVLIMPDNAWDTEQCLSEKSPTSIQR